MSARLIACVLLGSLCVSAQSPGDFVTILVSLIDRPVGREIFSITRIGTSPMTP
jgi:hypothetical protein